MKRNTLEATDAHVLNSIKNNLFNRIDDIQDFVETLDSIEGNMFISLDGKWGEGKTFYVRQIEQTLKYIMSQKWNSPREDLEPYFKGSTLDEIELNHTYLPIYYNAWLYDNHDDPLMSLLLVASKECKNYFSTKIDSSSISNKIISLLSCFSLSIKGINMSLEADRIQGAFKNNDILDGVKNAEEIRDTVKDIFDKIITEQAEKLVIFIDELDRCRPSYALEMLERIKHYFDDERIIFIISINKEQLVHTISNYYGSGFDSTGYLNKFFDLNIHMPVLSHNHTLFDTYTREQYFLTTIADGLNDYYKLTLRDSLLFKQRLSELPAKWVNDIEPESIYLSLFIPIIAILDIKNENEKTKFLEGKSDILTEFSENIPAIQRMICRFGGENQEFVAGFERIKSVYNYAFKDTNSESYDKLDLGINSNFKKICMKLYNGYNK